MLKKSIAGLVAALAVVVCFTVVSAQAEVPFTVQNASNPFLAVV